jgi:glycosyltransferase involved in cell wall biosynthesis
MKVLHLIWDLGQGGAQAYLSNLLRFHEKEEGLESELIVLTGPGVLSKSLERKVHHLLYFGMKHGFDVAAAVRLYFRIRSVRPDVIHLHTNTILVFIVCAVSRTPVIYTEHGVGLLRDCKYNILVGLFIYKVFYRWITCFIAVSETMRAKMIAKKPSIGSRITTIPNGIDIEQLLSSKSGIDGIFQPGKKRCTYKICAVGRLTAIKGIDLFIEIAAEIHRRQTDVCFFVIGDGELKSRLEAQAASLGVAEFVHFLGFRDDVLALMREFDLYLMTSHFESFGLTVIEAMGSGIPVVAAKAEAPFEEIIQHGVDGILAGNRDPRLIADIIIQLLQNEKLRTAMGSAAQKKVALKYTMKNNAQAVYACYKSVSAAKTCGKRA